MKDVITLFGCVLCVFVSTVSGASTTTPSGPPSLPTLPKTFQANIAIQIIDKSYSISATEYYDFPNNRGALKVIQRGYVSQIIYDYKLDQILRVAGGGCLVSNLSASDNSRIFGDVSSGSGHHMFTTNGALKFGKQFGETYMGNTTIRGIPVNWWQSSMYWPVENANFTVEYYFTIPSNSWKSASLVSPVPVRAVVNGTAYGKNSSHAFHHIYDYTLFYPHIIDNPDNVFQTPVSVVCPGRKRLRPIPKLPKSYYYREEIVMPNDHIITQADIWYVQNLRLLRYDYRYSTPAAPYYTTDALSEVHDYNTGVSYVIDKFRGNCSAQSLSKSSFGTKENITALKVNGSFVLHMKNPLNLFFLDNTYTWEGQRMVRGALCDVFISQRSDFKWPGDTKQHNSTFVYYFLAQTWADFSDKGNKAAMDIPFKLQIMMDDGINAMYNFFDFDEQMPMMSVFDVSACYSELAKLHFSIRIPGTYEKAFTTQLILETEVNIAKLMHIYPIRIQNIVIDNDQANIFIRATILDRVPAFAKFTHIPGKEAVQAMGAVSHNITSAKVCAQLCVAMANFVCNSFDLCPADQTCKMDNKHRSNNSPIKTSTCSHYSRTVNGPKFTEVSAVNAWNALRTAVFSGQFKVTVKTKTLGDRQYSAVSTIVTQGNYVARPLPQLTNQYSYRMELTMPSSKLVQEADVWFDFAYKLVRYDYRNTSPKAPFYTTNAMTAIHDFNQGISYNIDKVLGNCTITQLKNDSFDTSVNYKKQATDNSYILQMKNPLQLFHLDNSYYYSGRRTVRGIACDVFASLRNDFNPAGITKPFTSVFEVFFLATDWYMFVNPGATVDQNIPIRLDISAASQNMYLTYEFYDFDEEHPNLNVYDIRPCFNYNQRQNFVLKFPGKYHPVLDTGIKQFKQDVLLFLATLGGVSPLQFQVPQVTYDSSNIYYVATLVEHPLALLQFTKIANKQALRKSYATFNNVSSATTCASYCITDKKIRCESFDICPTVGKCALSKLHINVGPQVFNSKTCDHYSRTVNFHSNQTELTINTAYKRLKVSVLAGVVKLKIQNVLFKATDIATMTLRQTVASTGVDRTLKQFTTHLPQTTLKTHNSVLNSVTMDTCASACTSEQAFDCQSFSYCITTGTCYLSVIQPDDSPTQVASNPYCDLYSRTYLFRFQETAGITILTQGSAHFQMTTANKCAHKCMTYGGFNCKSFDYCPNLKTCVLGKKHILDVPVTQYHSNPACNHYSRKYISDFKRSPGRQITIKNDLVITGITIDACAKTCAGEQGFLCRSFDYCGNQTECRLSHVNTNSVNFKQIQISTFCDHFSRQYFPAGSPVNTTPKTTGYTSGAMTGVAFGLLIAGIIMGAILFYVVQKKQVSSTMDLNVQFSRQRLQEED